MSQPPGPPGSEPSSDPSSAGGRGRSGAPGPEYDPYTPAGPPPPPYPPPGYPGYGPEHGWPGYAYPTTNAKATAAMVTGITTLVLSWCCGFGLVGIVAIVLGARARTEIRRSGGHQEGDGLALTGIVTGAIAAAVGAAVLVAIGIALARTGSDLNQFR